MNLLKISMTLVLMGVILFGCKEKRKIEIVPNLESIYLSEKLVDVPPKESKELKTKFIKEIASAVSSFAEKESKKPDLFRIRLRLFVNQDGGIDKIKDIGTAAGSVDSLGNINNKINIDKLIEVLASAMNNWKFTTPALKNGQPVKSWGDMKVDLSKEPNGSYKIVLPDFLSNIPNMNDYVPVDKMPEVKKSAVPTYPDQAKRAGIEGTVYVKLLVNKNGVPTKAVVIKSDNEIFNQASIDAAIKFTFTPAYKDNMPIAVWVVIPFRYKLGKPDGQRMKYKELPKMKNIK